MQFYWCSLISAVRINCSFLLKRLLAWFNLFVLLFLATPRLEVAVHPWMEWITIKKKETKSKPPWQKTLKFQYRFKVHNTQINRRKFTRNYFGLKLIEIFKNLWLRFSLLKLAYYLSSRVIFLNVLKTTLPANKFTIQARGSKLQNMAWKQKSTA